MHTRIRFDNSGGSPLKISRQAFRVNGRDLRVVVHTEEMYFEIVDTKDNKALVRGGDTNNYNVLLRKARKALTDLGYTGLVTEQRNRNASEIVATDGQE